MRVKLYAGLRQAAATGQIDISTDTGDTIRDVLDRVIEKYPALANELYDQRGMLQPYVAVYLCGRESRHHQGLDTPVTDSDQLAIFPPAAGG